MKQRKLIAGIAALASAVLPMWSAAATEVQPMRHFIAPAEGVTDGQFTVANNRATALPIEIVVQERIFDQNGEMTLVDAEDDFLVFPFQALIEPNSTQAFRFKYLGDPQILEEKAYTLDVREVPVELPGDFTGFRVVYNFGVAVYVKNLAEKSAVTVSAVERSEAGIVLTVANASNSFARLSNDRMILKHAGGDIALEGEALTRRLDNIIVPPNRGQKVTIDLEGLELPEGQIDIVLDERTD